jgi:signal transduction histidine kinase
VQNLDTKWIHIHCTKDEDHIIIKVSDSGSGIPSAFRDKVMNPFFTTKDVGKGTGLGLSISFGIINSHSGQMYFDHSQPNTTMVVKIPRTIHVRQAA